MARPQAGQHGAPARGLRRGLAAELAVTLPRGRRGLLVLLGALAIVGAGILVGVILARASSGTGAPAGPPGPQGVAANQAGSPAAFTMTVPAGWHTSQRAAGTDFTSPAGGVSILITPTAAGGATDSGQIRRQLARSLRQGGFPGYEPVAGGPSPSRAGPGWPGSSPGSPPAGAGWKRGISRSGSPPGRPPGLPGAGIGARRRVGGCAAGVPERTEHVPGPLMTLAASPYGAGRQRWTGTTRVSNPCTIRPAARPRLRGCCSWSRTG